MLHWKFFLLALFIGCIQGAKRGDPQSPSALDLADQRHSLYERQVRAENENVSGGSHFKGCTSDFECRIQGRCRLGKCWQNGYRPACRLDRDCDLQGECQWLSFGQGARRCRFTGGIN